MTARDSGALEFHCEEFYVRFPAPAAPAPVATPLSLTPSTPKSPTGDAPVQASPYDRLFRGKKPRLGKAE